MIRCCFLGYSDNYELKDDLGEQISKAMEKLTRSGKRIEFWFTHVNTEYLKLCLSRVLLLKVRHPDCDIKIVRVFDPVREKENDWYRNTCGEHFPRVLSDKNVFSPVLNAGVEITSSNMIGQFYKVRHWVLRQCNHVFVYYYNILPDSSEGPFVESAMIQENTKVIQLGFPETGKFIREKADVFPDEKYRAVMNMIAIGSTLKEIGIALGVSGHKVRGITGKVKDSIAWELKKRRYDNSRKVRTCCIFGLNNTVSATQIVLFESLIDFLVRSYSVSEFLIDVKSSQTVYGAILAKNAYAKFCSGVNVNVFISEEMESKEWERFTQANVPPYHEIVNIGDGGKTLKSAYENVAQNSLFCISDKTSEQYPMIHNICIQNGDIRLIDISDGHLDIDTSLMTNNT